MTHSDETVNKKVIKAIWALNLRRTLRGENNTTVSGADEVARAVLDAVAGDLCAEGWDAAIDRCWQGLLITSDAVRDNLKAANSYRALVDEAPATNEPLVHSSRDFMPPRVDRAAAPVEAPTAHVRPITGCGCDLCKKARRAVKSEQP